MRTNQFMIYLLTVFISTIVLIVFLLYNSNSHINKLIHGNESLINEFSIIGETQKLESDMLYIESQIHRAVIGEDSSYLKGIRIKEKNARARLAMLTPLLLTDSTKGLLHLLDSLIDDKLQFGDNVLEALFTNGQSAAEEMYKSRKAKYAMGEIVDVIDSLINPRQQYLTKLAIDANRSGHSAKEWGIILAITAVLACMFTFWYIAKRISQQQHLFDQLNESEKKVRQAGILKENFMANMSHEIRTPMNAILGFTNLLLKEPLNEKSKEFVTCIQNSGENLLTIINDILDFSKIEAGMMRIESNPFSLRGLLNSVETMFTTRIQQKNLSLVATVEKTIPDLLKGDAVRLTQIMVNLVNNAVKFTNSGGVEINVTSGKKSGSDIYISFSVKDTGIGIPPDKIDFIFERFQQADENTTRRYGGTGLGLSIVKQLVELQNGTIHVNSVQNLGTEIIFTIPYIISKEFADKDNLQIVADHEIQLYENNIKILVAEDNVMNQNLMKHLLSDWNLDNDIVTNGIEAIEALTRENYDLVLMDIQMPKMDGYTATVKIRNELKSIIPIIAMTAHAMAGEREKCMSYGMNEYISKPIREEELFKMIHNLLRSNKAEKDYEKHDNKERIYSFEMLNLQYLQELSKGNKEFEKSMLELFLHQVPNELEALQDAFNNSNYTKVTQIAHNLKTSVSFMGLSEKLDSSLDYIENNAGVEKENTFVQERIMMVKRICLKVPREINEYLGHID
jgi:signal transduction histidine kinase/DNA-binding response OmpR family regulator